MSESIEDLRAKRDAVRATRDAAQAEYEATTLRIATELYPVGSMVKLDLGDLNFLFPKEWSLTRWSTDPDGEVRATLIYGFTSAAYGLSQFESQLLECKPPEGKDVE